MKDDLNMDLAEIRTEPIGKIHKGCDGWDQYLLLKRLDDDLTASQAEAWLLPKVYKTTETAGAYYCERVTISKLPLQNEVIAIVHHRFNT